MRKYKKYLAITLAYLSLLILGFLGIFFINRTHGRVLHRFSAPSAISKKLFLGKFIVLVYKIEAKSLKNIFDFAEKYNCKIKKLTINTNKNKIFVVVNPDLPHKFNTKIRRCLSSSKVNNKFSKNKYPKEKSINFIHFDKQK
jgi:hypothetical protein